MSPHPSPALRPLGLLALLAPASPALADVFAFQTPPGNIQCSLGQDFGVRAELWRTIVERQGPAATPALAGCRPGEGHEVRLAETGPPATLCDPRTTAGGGVPVIRYGQIERWGGIESVSSEAGFQCHDDDGHGFLLSRAAQRVWRGAALRALGRPSGRP